MIFVKRNCQPAAACSIKFSKLHYISLSFHSAGKLLTSFLHTKKGDRLLTNNYRPLCCKALEHIISSNIYSHLPQVKIFCDVLHGFRERRSCKSQLIVTIDDFMKYLNSKGLIHAIFLDFKRLLTRCHTRSFVTNQLHIEYKAKLYSGYLTFYLIGLKRYWLGVKSVILLMHCLVSPVHHSRTFVAHLLHQ